MKEDPQVNTSHVIHSLFSNIFICRLSCHCICICICICICVYVCITYCSGSDPNCH